ncbi:hypothetical protein PVAP13_9NG513600 [Panicum virgatum]|uniref:Uncharacterized protein n=1 Tax=Panicum virgatum TaxID=38727 RepID=A0A8T0MTW1_PANVG|nr:hypothetical protein PVAP13_9NG513600 [Panicum virgatum]
MVEQFDRRKYFSDMGSGIDLNVGLESEDSGFAGSELAQPTEAFDTYSFVKTYALPEFGTHAETIGSTNKSSKRYWIRYLLVKSI